MKVHTETPPRLHRCEFAVEALLARMREPSLTACPVSLPSLVPNCNLTKLCPAGEETRCLTPKGSQTLWPGCAYSRQVKKREPGLPSASGVTQPRHCTSLCPPQQPRLKDRAPRYLSVFAVATKQTEHSAPSPFLTSALRFTSPFGGATPTVWAMYTFAALRPKFAERCAGGQQLQEGREELTHSISAESNRGCTIKSNFAAPKRKCRVGHLGFCSL